MAKRTRTKTGGSSGVSGGTWLALAAVLVLGFVAGFMVAKHRDMKKISVISEMNMQKAVALDDLHRQLQVLGAHTEK